jgi:hypothetical protein
VRIFIICRSTREVSGLCSRIWISTAKEKGQTSRKNHAFTGQKGSIQEGAKSSSGLFAKFNATSTSVTYIFADH